MANILSLTTINNKGTLQDYLAHLGAKLSRHEVDSLTSLCNLLISHRAPFKVYDHYFVGYSIPQISKEFDLLRIGSDTIINIELKSAFHYDNALKQLQKNYLYLKYLSKKLLLYTFSSSTNKVYRLSEDRASLEEVASIELINELASQDNFFDGNLDDLFNPTNYLVSPFNATEKFIAGEYFLTNQQDDIKARTLASFTSSNNNIVALQGSAGTGKTLLLYDIAKTLACNDMLVLIAHTGRLNKGHIELRDSYGYNIVSVKTLYDLVLNNGIEKYDCVIIDESQRLYTSQITHIFKKIQEKGINAIFGFDPRQVLRDTERSDHLIDAIDSSRAASYRLTKKIRTNKEVAQFIRALFKLSYKKDTLPNKRISAIHFNSYEAAKAYIESSRSDYTLATLTPSTVSTNAHAIDIIGTSSVFEGTAHQVIGQEFDNVIVVIDDVFFYNSEGDLVSRKRGGVLYDQRDMLFQIVTRTRNKLEIVVVNNELVFREILSLT